MAVAPLVPLGYPSAFQFYPTSSQANKAVRFVAQTRLSVQLDWHVNAMTDLLGIPSLDVVNLVGYFSEIQN